MSNGEIHQISREIGELTSGLRALKEEVASFRKSFDAHVRDLESKVDDLAEFRNRGMGILFGVSLAAGGIGAAVKMLWDYMRGHTG